MSGAVAEVLRLGTALLDGVRGIDLQLGNDGLPVVSLLALAALAGAAAWRTSGWPADAAASAPTPGGWVADGAMRGAIGDGDAMGVMNAETPGGGE